MRIQWRLREGCYDSAGPDLSRRGPTAEPDTSQTTRAAVFFQLDGAAVADVFQAFFEGGLSFGTEWLFSVLKLSQVIKHVGQAVLGSASTN